jgi:hypothetical protein
MNNSVQKLAALGAINVGLLFALPGSSPGTGPQPSAMPPTYAAPATKILAPSGKGSGPKTEIQAEILPAATYAVGKSLSGGPDGKNYGIGLTANDISNSWTTCSSTCTLDFVFFVFTNQDQTADVQFKVLSPTDSTVYQNTWTSHLVPTNWYAVSAKGSYHTAGTYFAEVYVAGKLEGWAPVVFTKSS